MTSWWESDPAERYWVEIRWAEGIGTALRCPQFNDDGNRNGWYDLVTQVSPGDQIYHWHAREHRFVGRSTAADSFSIDQNEQRVVPLTEFAPLPVSFDLDDLRANSSEIYRVHDQIRERQPRGPLYLPFQFRIDGLRMISNYFAKWPQDLVGALFGDSGLLAEATTSPPVEEGPDAPSKSPFPGGYLQPFKPKGDTEYNQTIQGGVRRHGRHHETLVNDFADWLTGRGFSPARNAAIDLGLADPPVIIEAKILTTPVAPAIRSAVGQLYEYRHFHVVDPHSDLIILLDARLPDEWVEYLEEDRDIGVVHRDGTDWVLNDLAKDALG